MTADTELPKKEMTGGPSTGESPDPRYRGEIALDRTKLLLLFNASKALVSTTDIDQLLAVIIGEVRTVLECEGAAVVLYDEERDEFYWRSVQDTDSLLSSAREYIRIPKDLGVAGWVFERGLPALVNDATTDPRIYRTVEDRSGFTTRNMICVPLKTREKALGVLYALNKVGGSFTPEDVEILVALSGNVALSLENAAHYESLMQSHQELERLNRVKNKILNHLSHELKTPLAIVDASVRILKRKIEELESLPPRLPFNRIQRGLERLKTIERQVGHIVEERDTPYRQTVSAFLDDLVDLITVKLEQHPDLAEAVEIVKETIEEQFPTKVVEKEGIDVSAAFQAALFRVTRMTEDRDLDVEFVPPDPALIRMQPQILMSVIGGLVRNAVENTPDHGKIVVAGTNTPDGYRISVRDYGIGIPHTELANIFEGFYPIQETDFYTSGRPYGFNAGGSGTDLLKMKIFSERFGFKITFKSTRCSCIPTARDVCPGDISQCSCCTRPEDCYANGGTEFVVEIPSEMVDIGQDRKESG